MTFKLKIENRNIFGKKLKFSRKEGKIPAVVYGKGKDSLPIFVHLKEFKKAWKKAGESAIIELKQEDSGQIDNVVIKDIAINPISDEPIHVDFYKVEMDKPITANVPLIFEGVSPAVKELGGSLVKVMHEIEIESLPKDMPHEIKIDIGQLLRFEDRITVGDLDLPLNVNPLPKEEEVVALVEEPKEEEVVAEERTIEDIEVEKKGKKPVEGEEEEEEEKEEATSNE
ncbi:50S ribosomal protein L25 [Patescibacteria group bacterium]|nr:50S ribosomal protein L25 [Patescibacteria group bacterium]